MTESVCSSSFSTSLCVFFVYSILTVGLSNGVVCVFSMYVNLK